MSVSQLLSSIGGVAVVVGMGAIAVAHCAVAPELRRSVDVARQAVNDGAAAVVVLSHTVEAAEALRPPTEAVSRRYVAMLKPAIALLEAGVLRVLAAAIQKLLQHAHGHDEAEDGADREFPRRAPAGCVAAAVSHW